MHVVAKKGANKLRQPPGRVLKPWLAFHHGDGPRVNKQEQRAFEKHKPYCLYIGPTPQPLFCFKTKAQAERELRAKRKDGQAQIKFATERCQVDDARLVRWKRAAERLDIPKGKGSLRDATLELKASIDTALAAQAAQLKECKTRLDELQSRLKARTYAVRRYTRGSKTRKAVANPRSPWHTANSKEAKRKGARRG